MRALRQRLAREEARRTACMLAPLALAVLVSCGDSDSSVRTSLELRISLSGQQVDGDGTLVDEQAIDLADGSAWRVFSEAIDTEFAGQPEALRLEQVSIELLDSSQGVLDLGDVFNGPIAFRFQTTSQTQYSLAVADIRAASQASVLNDFLIEFNYPIIDSTEQALLLAGQMQTLFVGQAGEEFRDSASIAELSARLDFVATPPPAPTP